MADRYTTAKIAGDFPPSLNTLRPADQLKPNETPDGYGYDLTAWGTITAGTIPTGSSRIQKAVTLEEGPVDGKYDVPYIWHYNRLWNITGRAVAGNDSTTLTYGAPFYQDIYYPQGLGKIPLDEDANAIKAFVPFEPDSAYVGKTTGGYVLQNLSDSRAFFQRSDLIQELALPAANQVIELDNTIFVNSANGIHSYSQGKTTEVSMPIRGLSGVTIDTVALTADYTKKRIIVGSVLVWDTATERWFRYNSSSFLYTSPALVNPDMSAFTVDRLLFHVEHTTTDDKTLTYSTRVDDGSWTDDRTMILNYRPGEYTLPTESLAMPSTCRKFQMRITEFPSGLTLKDILMTSTRKNIDDYTA